MKQLTLKEICIAVNGKLNNEGFGTLKISDVKIDSRLNLSNSLFVAINGENFNAHKFVLDTYKKECVCCLVDEKIDTNYPIIKVDDTKEAMLKLAMYYKSLFNITTIAVTGSCGKTTTKDTIHSVLSQKYNVLKTEGNFNNDIGVPLTLFRIKEEHDIAVIEMGMNHFGEIEKLSEVAKPDIAVITNIGNAHIENLGDKYGVLKAKLEITKGLKENGTLILNGDDELLKSVENDKFNIIKYGKSKESDYIANNIKLNGLTGSTFDIKNNDKTFNVNVNIVGEFMIYNCLSASICGRILDLSDEEIKKGIYDLQLTKNRLDVISANNDIKIINDVYNANPESMKSAIGIISNLEDEGRRIVILGDMFELGKEEEKEHINIGKILNDKKIDMAIFIGSRMEFAYNSITNNSINKMYFKTQNDFFDKLDNIKFERKDIILIKGSRGMQLEKTVDKIKEL